jgi:hypothetical protein
VETKQQPESLCTEEPSSVVSSSPCRTAFLYKVLLEQITKLMHVCDDIQNKPCIGIHLSNYFLVRYLTFYTYLLVLMQDEIEKWEVETKQHSPPLSNSKQWSSNVSGLILVILQHFISCEIS